MSHLSFKILTPNDIKAICRLAKQLNPSMTLHELETFQEEMFKIPTYQCFGLYIEKKLIGISSGWITIRFYSGKQLEVDNVIIDNNEQSNGYGRNFFDFIEQWAIQNQCKNIELNTYVHNTKSHKFYYNLGFSILGFHFVKKLENTIEK